MIHPCTELRFINNEIGYGVVATERIPRGTVVWSLDKLDREFSPLQILEFDEAYQEILRKYCFRNNNGHYVLCWDNGRYVNHSFRSNCVSTAYNLELAVRDILPGEELTDDYGFLNLWEPFKALDERTRRKYVYPDDLLKYYRMWDQKLLGAFKRLPYVDQPLKPVIPPATWERCLSIASGEVEMESTLNLYFDPFKGNAAPDEAGLVPAGAQRDDGFQP